MKTTKCLTAGEIIQLLTQRIECGQITAEYKVIIYSSNGRNAISSITSEPDKTNFNGPGNLMIGFSI